MSGRVTVVGLGPAGLDRLDAGVIDRLTDPAVTVVVRTLHHPAADELAHRRSVVACDDLYETAENFDAVYDGIVERVLGLAGKGDVVYAVPGSAAVGERAVPRLLARAGEQRLDVRVIPGESFIDPACIAVGVDPIADGLQILDARALPDPLPLHLPALITQIDTPLVTGEVAIALGRLLPDGYEVTLLDRLGEPDEEITALTVGDLPRIETGPRTTLFVPAADVGWLGLVSTNRVLRTACPWDAEQTHHTIASHLVEEAYETVDAIGRLPVEAPSGDVDVAAYVALEEELGDLLLQVVFHATLATEAGAFDVDEVAEGVRRKLVYRHPHVFGDVVAGEVSEVLANWEELKNAEKGRESLMDDVPPALPGIARAEKIQRRASTVGFDWSAAEPVFAKVREELDELRAVASDRDRATGELGDLLFSVVNLARHLDVDPEIALARTNDVFSTRFRVMERIAAERGVRLRNLEDGELEELWEKAKVEGSTP